MISATVLGLFFVPVFFVVIRKLLSRRAPKDAAQGTISGDLAHA
jgi:hypothetical protein